MLASTIVSPEIDRPESRVSQPPREPEDASGVSGERAERTLQDAAVLLAGIRRGDADAFETLAREQSPRLYRVAFHLTGRAEDAEDLVQETLLRCLPALRAFEGRARVSTYLLRALSNLWKNRLRARSRSRIVAWLRLGPAQREEEENQVLDPPEAAPSPLERMETLEAAARLRKAIARLDPDRRMVLLLREVEELSYEEIATITGVPVGTVRSRLARARADLRKLVGEGT